MLSLVLLAASGAAAHELLAAVPDMSLPGVNANGLARVVHLAAAAAGQPFLVAAVDDADACATAVNVISYCYDELPATAAATDEASCFCCLEGGATTTYLGDIYTSCENYVSTEAPLSTDAASALSIVESFCSSMSADGFQCDATPTGASATPTAAVSGSATATATASATASATATGAPSVTASATFNAARAACTSFADAYEACAAATPGFENFGDRRAASCLCYDTSGDYVTTLDDFIESCATYVRTATPSLYSDYLALTTFCEDYAPNAATTAADASSDAKVQTFAGVADSSAAVTSAPTATRTRSTVTVSPTAAATGAAAHVRSGFAAWAAVVLPLVL